MADDGVMGGGAGGNLLQVSIDRLTDAINKQVGSAGSSGMPAPNHFPGLTNQFTGSGQQGMPWASSGMASMAPAFCGSMAP